MNKVIDTRYLNHKKEIETIARSAEFSDILLSNLADYLGYGEIIHKPISLKEVLEELIPFILPRLPNNVHFEKDINVDASKILANKNQLKQIILNLVSNAIWAMRDKRGRHIKHILSQNCQRTRIFAIRGN